MEQHRNGYNVLPPCAISTIRVHAHCLTRAQVIPGMALEDYEQELAVDLWRRLPAYRAELASLATYIDRVVRNRVASFYAAARSAARRHERDALARTPADNSDPTRKLQSNDDWAIADQLTDQIGLRHDLARFVAAMPPALRRCCEIVMSGSGSDAVREHGLHRSSYYEALRRLRQRAPEAGLQEYLA